MGFSYNAYYNTAFLAPLVVFIISFNLATVVIYLTIGSLTNYKLCSNKYLEKIDATCKLLLFEGLKLIYGDRLKECKETSTCTIYGRRVHRLAMPVLFMVVTLVCSCTVVAFWTEFLVYETDHCDTNLDCFVQNISDGIEEYLPVMENCTDYELENGTISCFIFIFDYAGALGNAGGVLVLATIIMNVQAGLSSGALTIMSTFWRRVAILIISVIWILVTIVISCLVIIVPSVKLLNDQILGTQSNTLKFTIYWSTFIGALTVSSPLMFVKSNRENESADIHQVNPDHELTHSSGD